MTRQSGVSTLGLDIGGANLKWSVSDGPSGCVPFAMWRHPEQLSQRLVELDQQTGQAERVAVTMTGELADGFENRRSGVAHIVDACVQAFGERRVAFYSIAGRMIDARSAVRLWEQVASANWHAAAAVVAARFGSGLWIDMGSTTTDVIPFQNGSVHAVGKDDLSRMLNGELVYTGVARTPVAAVLPVLSWHERHIPLAAELFATMADTYLLAGWQAPNVAENSCADGRPMTVECSRQRIARMVCSDADTLDPAMVTAIVHQSIAAQKQLIETAVRQISCRFDWFETHAAARTLRVSATGRQGLEEGCNESNCDGATRPINAHRDGIIEAERPALVITGSGAAIARRLLAGSDWASGFSFPDSHVLWHRADGSSVANPHAPGGAPHADIQQEMLDPSCAGDLSFCAWALLQLADELWDNG